MHATTAPVAPGRAGRVAALLLALMSSSAPAQDVHAARRGEMVEEIRMLARATGAETGRPMLAAPVIAALARVPRHEFVPPAAVSSAYDNRPLPIGHGQTISQPFIVALMTDLLEIKPTHKVLEVGTGSAYQAAVLAELAHTVYTVEIVQPLAQAAAKKLAALGYRNIVARAGDGYRGWPEHAPYDAIMVTAGAPELPPALIEQLRPGGRLVIPVGPQMVGQDLLLIEKSQAGEVTKRKVLSVRFVPLTGGTR